jgi:hypothetical protein
MRIIRSFTPAPPLLSPKYKHTNTWLDLLSSLHSHCFTGTCERAFQALIVQHVVSRIHLRLDPTHDEVRQRVHPALVVALASVTTHELGYREMRPEALSHVFRSDRPVGLDVSPSGDAVRSLKRSRSARARPLG